MNENAEGQEVRIRDGHYPIAEQTKLNRVVAQAQIANAVLQGAAAMKMLSPSSGMEEFQIEHAKVSLSNSLYALEQLERKWYEEEHS